MTFQCKTNSLKTVIKKNCKNKMEVPTKQNKIMKKKYITTKKKFNSKISDDFGHKIYGQFVDKFRTILNNFGQF